LNFSKELLTKGLTMFQHARISTNFTSLSLNYKLSSNTIYDMEVRIKMSEVLYAWKTLYMP